MKRILEQFNILPVWPLLTWLTCNKCLHQFRREAGWSYTTDWQSNDHKRYVCSNCCPTTRHVQEFFTKLDTLQTPPSEE
jgi:hypothetical protein